MTLAVAVSSVVTAPPEYVKFATNNVSPSGVTSMPKGESTLVTTSTSALVDRSTTDTLSSLRFVT